MAFIAWSERHNSKRYVRCYCKPLLIRIQNDADIFVEQELTDKDPDPWGQFVRILDTDLDQVLLLGGK